MRLSSYFCKMPCIRQLHQIHTVPSVLPSILPEQTSQDLVQAYGTTKNSLPHLLQQTLMNQLRISFRTVRCTHLCAVKEYTSQRNRVEQVYRYMRVLERTMFLLFKSIYSRHMTLATLAEYASDTAIEMCAAVSRALAQANGQTCCLTTSMLFASASSAWYTSVTEHPGTMLIVALSYSKAACPCYAHGEASILHLHICQPLWP